MRIGVVTNLYPPVDRGGAEHVALRIVRELYARGHDVFVISTEPFSGISSFFPHITEKHIERVYRVYPLNIYHPLKDFKYPWIVRLLWHIIDAFQPLSSGVVKSICQEEKPDVILSHNLKGFGLRASSAIRELGIPNIHTLHDVQLSLPSGLLMVGQEDSFMNRSVFRRMYEWVTRKIVASPTVVLSPSKFLADFYRERSFFPKSEVIILPNPAPYGSLPVSKVRQSGPLRLLFAGQLEHHKGIIFLLDTLLEIKDLSFELHIAGDGSLAKEILKRIEGDKRFVFHGFVSLEILQKLFAISDAVVVPSLCYENSPTIIYESLQSGVPVIAANIGGVGELVSDGENGFLFEAGKKDQLTKILSKFAQDATNFKEKAEIIQESVKDHNLNKYIDRLEEIMESIQRPTL